MKTIYTVVLAGVLAGAAIVSLHAAEPLVFSGEVARGDTLVHRFAHRDRKLEFRLVPHTDGWTIWVGAPSQLDRNYVGVATPPFRGLNPAVIEGWHFRNVDNTGPNTPGPKNVNAPGDRRQFAFVLDGSGYSMAQAALDILLWPDGYSAESVEDARKRFREIPTGSGILEVKALELGNLVPNERAKIDRMAFTVRITIAD